MKMKAIKVTVVDQLGLQIDTEGISDGLEAINLLSVAISAIQEEIVKKTRIQVVPPTANPTRMKTN
jgi:hypothetical protein